ncbi:MAG: SIS domain-containing protein [Sphingopyxis sp.]|uniref:SIS domain-containing protein n=1 Tax=Sphingopyxis sp. TaxID=1908224 RepID=UPI003D81090E
MTPPPQPDSTLMFVEAREASQVVARQLAQNAALAKDLADLLLRPATHTIFTCARGSSDHAAAYAKFQFETRLRKTVTSHPPSLGSIYRVPMDQMAGQPFILISQSGKSPDLLASAEVARAAGAIVVAIVNDESAPLADLADIVMPLHAGPERSVAATKSFIATLSAIAQIVSQCPGEQPLLAAMATLPDQLAHAWDASWDAALAPFSQARSLFVLGRGPSFGVALEAALKFKETCGIHAEAFSTAEVAHGPMALVERNFPILVFPPLDEAQAGMAALLGMFLARDATVAAAGPVGDGAITLPVAPGLHPAIAPIAMIQSFYRLANALAIARGFDPDAPPLLKKVTETI